VKSDYEAFHAAAKDGDTVEVTRLLEARVTWKLDTRVPVDAKDAVRVF
jgi:hypothetical protein